jgi:hypothetical protein
LAGNCPGIPREEPFNFQRDRFLPVSLRINNKLQALLTEYVIDEFPAS